MILWFRTGTMLLHAAQCICRWGQTPVFHISCTVNPALLGRIAHSLSISHTVDVRTHNPFNKDQNHQMFGSLVGNERFWCDHGVSYLANLGQNSGKPNDHWHLSFFLCTYFKLCVLQHSDSCRAVLKIIPSTLNCRTCSTRHVKAFLCFI